MSYNISVTRNCPQSFLGPSLTGSCPGTQFLLFMTLLDTFIRSRREIAQLCKRVRPVNPPDRYYDFIVVGGGSAGAVVANRLSEVPAWKILLLEAGPDEPPGADVPSMFGTFIGSEIDWQYRTTDEPNACLMESGSCRWPRGKTLGGTSVHNSMVYVRGHPRDFDNWAALGNEGWTWSEVLPYFTRSENNSELSRLNRHYHRKGGLLTVERFPWLPSISKNILDAAVEKGYGLTDDLNGANMNGFTVAQTTSKNGVRVSSASAFLRPVRNRKNLHIALNATATKILFKKSKAIGVQYVQDGQTRVARSKREIIVSGGAVNSPQLLLLSGIGPRDHLEAVNVSVVKDLPGVGENLHDHVVHNLTYTIDEPNEYDLNWAVALQYVSYQKGPMASTGLSQISGVVASKYTTPDYPDLQFFFGGYRAICSVTGEIGALQNDGRRSINVFPTNLHPLSRGTLRLASNDPMAKPIIVGNYLKDPLDVDVLVEGIKIVISLMNSTSMAKLKTNLTSPPIEACMEFPFLSTEYWKCATHWDSASAHHQAGSCKMGPSDDPMAVVDPRLKVHGIRGLRVADTSIMPQVTSGNTAAPAMMIGERLAAFVKEDWQSGSVDCDLMTVMDSQSKVHGIRGKRIIETSVTFNTGDQRSASCIDIPVRAEVRTIRWRRLGKVFSCLWFSAGESASRGGAATVASSSTPSVCRPPPVESHVPSGFPENPIRQFETTLRKVQR